MELIDMNSETFKEELEFALWSTGGSSDYRNDRERPYNGQPHTDEGERGKTEVKGLTMRDVADCFIKAMLISAPDEEYLRYNEFVKCWNCEGDKETPTQYLLDKQKEGKYLSTTVDTNTWRYQMVYKINSDNIDPLAVCRNLTCEIEKMMGIYPNVPKL